MNETVLVCFAVPQEAKPFRRVAVPGPNVHIIITGMGATNAERVVAQALLKFHPSRLFTCGFAGALDPSLQLGDVLYEPVNASESLAQKLRTAGAKPGTFHCAGRIATTAREKSELRELTRATAVEMESGAIQKLCAVHGVECVTVRAISDTATEDLPLDFNRLLTRDAALSAWRLALAVMKAPQKVPALLRLGTHSALAARQLAQVLTRVLNSSAPQ